MKNNIIIIGGGAAGFFAAINAAEKSKDSTITILEKSTKLLTKVKVSGGGRCNVTHACQYNSELIKYYPRGEKTLREAFDVFSVKDIVEWFEKRGVKIKTEDDGRMFPMTNNSQTIIDCFLKEVQRLKIEVKTNTEVLSIEKKGDRLLLNTSTGEIIADKVLIAAGGNAKEEAYGWMKKLGHTIVKPVPSLFTFNMPKNNITELMGVSVPMAKAKIAGTKLETTGPLLITHWGMSGPAILKLSAIGARDMFKMNYSFTLLVNWIPKFNEEKLRIEIAKIRRDHSNKYIHSYNPFELPTRLWEYLFQKAGLIDAVRWADIPKKNQNILINSLLNDEYKVSGKTTFKDEFVTCGGIKLSEVDFKTMQSRIVPNIYFAGEVLDIDGITGGFNFQNAWTTAWIASQFVSF